MRALTATMRLDPDIDSAAISGSQGQAPRREHPGSDGQGDDVVANGPAEILTTCAPSSRTEGIAPADVSRAASASPITAMARPSTPTSTAVSPAEASSSRRASRSPSWTPSSAMSLRLPTTTRRASASATAPCPGTLRKPEATLPA